MHSNEFFNQILRLHPPFSVSDVVLQKKDDATTKRIDIFLTVDTDFVPQKNGNTCLGLVSHDQRSWQHLSVFNFPCYLHCAIPRFKYKNRTTGRISYRAVGTPWSKARSSFTKELEAWTMHLIEIHGNIANVSRQLNIEDSSRQ